MRAVVLGLCTAMVLVTRVADAQMPLPAGKPPDGATLFKQQCAVCHTTNLSEPARQGPALVKVVGRPAGKTEGFKYSDALSKADFAWDETRLDAWLSKSAPFRKMGRCPGQHRSICRSCGTTPLLPSVQFDP